jgi:hypothetical protein
VASVFNDFTQLHVQALDGVGGVDDAPDVRRESKERNDMFPRPILLGKSFGHHFISYRANKVG